MAMLLEADIVVHSEPKPSLKQHGNPEIFLQALLSTNTGCGTIGEPRVRVTQSNMESALSRVYRRDLRQERSMVLVPRRYMFTVSPVYVLLLVSSDAASRVGDGTSPLGNRCNVPGLSASVGLFLFAKRPLLPPCLVASTRRR